MPRITEDFNRTVDAIKKASAEMVRETERSSQEMINQITGGNSYPKVDVRIWGRKRQGVWTVSCVEKYPLYDVKAYLDDYSGDLDTEHFAECSTISSGKQGYSEKVTIEDSKTYKFVANCVARNGEFQQTIIVKKVDRKYVYATKIYKAINTIDFKQVYENGIEKFSPEEVSMLDCGNYDDYMQPKVCI